jgi:hypothetical protein
MSLRTLRRLQKNEKRTVLKYLILITLSLFFISSVMGSAYGEFKAEGKRGWVKFTGRGGSVTVEGKGKLWVTVSRDSKAEIDGTFKSQKKEGQTDYYEGFQGKVKIKGLNFKVEIRGEAIKIEALARGKAAMRGVGTFSTGEKKSKEWGKDYKWAHCGF